MRIVWDEWKRQANLLKHGLDFAVLDAEFFEMARIGPAKRGRLRAVGRVGGIICVIFVRLGCEGLSVISMRPASRTERKMLDG
ncbi:MAG: BrnT family toxin [Bosea sp. (in: a-proteobacteria)]|jgi:uncharacterized protein